MPRVVKNFWIEGSVDGSKRKVGIGPSGADGGFSLKIKIRSRGEVWEKYVYIQGDAMDGGRVLRLKIEGPDGLHHVIETER